VCAKSSHGFHGLLGFNWQKPAIIGILSEIRAIRGCFFLHAV
jgi:hypothetical protein